MPSLVHWRLAGYSVTLAIHLYTFYDVLARLAVTSKDPAVAEFAKLQAKFLTIWNFLFQIVYVILGLSCDVSNLRAGEINAVSKTMNWYRETLFAAIVWPVGTFMPSLFWTLYLYDSSLIFPPFIDQILSSTNNQVLHTYTGLVVLWELVFLRRSERNHKLNLFLLGGYACAYLFTLYNSYLDRGKFLYPILDQMYGTAIFYLFFILIVAALIFFYTLQWPLTSLVWGKEVKKKSGKKIR